MAAGAADRLWEIGDIVDVLEAWEASIGRSFKTEKTYDKVRYRHRHRLVGLGRLCPDNDLSRPFGTIRRPVLD